MFGCGRRSRQPLPGILRCQRASEAFQKAIYQQHLDGINRSRLGRREGIGAATVERHFRRGLQRQFAERHPPRCPQFLGIDEHFFTRRKGYATTLCDLKNHKVYDVVLGRSETALEAYFQRLEGKEHVLLVCMELSSPYRALVRRFFPNARIVADRFHVIRIINHHFLQIATHHHIARLGPTRPRKEPTQPTETENAGEATERSPLGTKIFHFEGSLPSNQARRLPCAWNSDAGRFTGDLVEDHYFGADAAGHPDSAGALRR